MQSSEEKRLQVFMAACGIGSRRACELLIEEGRVAVNGETVTRQGVKVDPATDSVTLDGKKLHEVSEKLYFALHKPPGYICTNQDPEGRPLAVSLLGPLAKRNRLFSVGRLDLLSSGLILYTNDGAFARAVAHPSAGVEKEYLVETRKPVEEPVLEEFVHGIVANGVRYTIVRYRMKSPTMLFVVLREGKNRELRNMFAARRIQIRRIHRIRIGSVSLGNLQPGSFRYLSRREVAALESAVQEPRGRQDAARNPASPRRKEAPHGPAGPGPKPRRRTQRPGSKRES